eukprot:Phypoly_transcript_03090.p1 GENE.Phypoly_transcript_03090~~Phypoly_transcript_03090.p1  ORF type:complete len:799 (+),score=132.97 Phypoly_transcript_03090:161-2557(+)
MDFFKDVKHEIGHIKQELKGMDPKELAASLCDKLRREPLREDDLLYVIEKLKSPLVQHKFAKNIQQVVVTLQKNVGKAQPPILARLFEIIAVVTESHDDIVSHITAVPDIEKLFLNAIRKAPAIFAPWSEVIANCSQNIQFAVLLLKSPEFGPILLGGLKLQSEDAQVNVIHTYQNMCKLLPESPVLAEWQALDALANVLKSGSMRVKGEIVNLLAHESTRESHQVFLASSTGPLVEVLTTAPDTIKEQILDIVLNVTSHEGVKILLIDAGLLTIANDLYQFAHGSVRSKAKQVLVSYGAFEDSGLLSMNNTVKGLGKNADVASYGVKHGVIIPTVYTATAMVELLRSGSEDSKAKAADVLMKMAQHDEENIFASKEIIKPLVDCQKSGSERMRSLAAFSLGKVTMNNPAAAVHIADELHYAVDLLKSSDDQVKNTALQALWMFSFQQECKDKLKEPQTVALIKTCDGSPALVDSAHMLLFQIGEFQPKRLWPLVRKTKAKTFIHGHTRGGEHDDVEVTGSIELLLPAIPSPDDELLPTPNLPPEHAPEVHKGNHIMISYNWGNQEMVKTIKKGLADHGYNCWIDIEQMQGSTLEAMANAVEQASVVLICYSKKYKESAACRTEAEYSFTLKKPIIPLKMEHSYVPDGWLGALLGSKLYHEFSSIEAANFATTLEVLVRELGNRGKENPLEDSLPITTITTENGGNSSRDLKPADIKKIDIIGWDLESVVTWLDAIGLAKTNASHFRTEFMDGKALFELYEILEKATPSEFAALIAPLGFRALGHRLRFQSELRDLFK